MGPDAMILVFWMVSLSQLFHSPLVFQVKWKSEAKYFAWNIHIIEMSSVEWPALSKERNQFTSLYIHCFIEWNNYWSERDTLDAVWPSLSFYRWGNWGSQRLSALLTVTYSCRNQGPDFLPYVPYIMLHSFLMNVKKDIHSLIVYLLTEWHHVRREGFFTHYQVESLAHAYF